MQETMLLQAETLVELCAGMGTVALAADVLADVVYAELQQCVKLTPTFAVARPLLRTYCRSVHSDTC